MSASDIDKLRVLLPHWLSHNHGHREEFGHWAEVARGAGLLCVADLIGQAMAKMAEVDGLLAQALEKAGGKIDGQGHHHHH
jgi:hypothetical protein